MIAAGAAIVLVAGTRSVSAAEPGVQAWTVGGPTAKAVGLAGLAAAAGALLAGPYARIAAGVVAATLPLLLLLVPAPEGDSGWTGYPPDPDVLRLWGPVLWVGMAILAVGGVVCVLSGWRDRPAGAPADRRPRRTQPPMWDALDRGEDPTA